MLGRFHRIAAARRRRPEEVISLDAYQPQKNAVILHGTAATPRSGWIPWVESELRWRGYEVWAPQLPGAEVPDIDAYWDALWDYDYNDRTVLIGHGSGAVAAFGIVQRMAPTVRLRRLVAVAPFYRDDHFGAGGLLKGGFDWAKVRRQVEAIDLVWDPDDPLIEVDQIELVSDRLRVPPTYVRGRGRMVLESRPSTTLFPELIDMVEARPASVIEG